MCEMVDQHGRLLSNDATVETLPWRQASNPITNVTLKKPWLLKRPICLTPILGAANFRVQIASDIDFSKVEETEDLRWSVVRKRDLTEWHERVFDGARYSRALSNTPPVTDGEPQQSPTPRLIEVKHRVIMRWVARFVILQHQQGVLQNLSVSIVVNDLANPNQTWTLKKY